MSAGAAVALLGVFFGLVVVSGPLMLAVANRKTPWAISRRLRAGTPSIVRRTSYTAGVWNPAKPLGRGNSTPNVPGWRATYSFTDDGMVKLDLAHRDGRRVRHIGPPVNAPEGLVRATKMALVPTVCYLVAIGAGLGLGLVAAGARGAAIGAVAGFVIAWFALSIFAAGWRARITRRNESPGPPPASPEW